MALTYNLKYQKLNFFQKVLLEKETAHTPEEIAEIFGDLPKWEGPNSGPSGSGAVRPLPPPDASPSSPSSPEAEDDRNIFELGVLFQFRKKRKTVFAGEHEIEQNEVNTACGERISRSIHIYGSADAIALLDKFCGQQLV